MSCQGERGKGGDNCLEHNSDSGNWLSLFKAIVLLVWQPKQHIFTYNICTVGGSISAQTAIILPARSENAGKFVYLLQLVSQVIGGIDRMGND